MSLRKTKLRDSHTEIDTGPLNDILFILLMFFLMITPLLLGLQWLARPRRRAFAPSEEE